MQLRNLITSAVPRGVTLPNPLSPDLKVDLLPEMTMDPLTAKIYFSDFSLPTKIMQLLPNALQSPSDTDLSPLSELPTSISIGSMCSSQRTVWMESKVAHL